MPFWHTRRPGRVVDPCHSEVNAPGPVNEVTAPEASARSRRRLIGRRRARLTATAGVGQPATIPC